jgi:hypothetical protein
MNNPMNDPASYRDDLQRITRRALVSGGVALVVCLLGALIDPPQFFRSYLAAWLFCLGLALGSLALLMIYHLTGGAWGLLIRRILEAQTRTLPLLALMFVPIALGMIYLFPWSNPELVADDERLQAKQFYLNPPFFFARTATYFMLWIGFAWLLNRWSRKQDATGEPRLAADLLQWSGFGAVAYGLTLHFAAVDYVSSLQPAFHSSIWGPLLAVTQLLSALAASIGVLAWLLPRTELGEIVSTKAIGDLASLLFSFVVLFAYMEYFQFMLIWMANVQIDVIFYLPRYGGAWKVIGWLLIALGFAAPFLLLLLRSVKQRPARLAKVCWLIVAMQLVHLYYEMIPAFAMSGFRHHWMNFVMPLALGGLWAAYFLWQLGRLPLVAPHDPNLASVAHLRHLDEEEVEREEVLAHE